VHTWGKWHAAKRLVAACEPQREAERQAHRPGAGTWQFLGSDGRPIEAFASFVESLRNSSSNTRQVCSSHVAEFLDCLIEASQLIGQGRQLTSLELSETIEAWGDNLVRRPRPRPVHADTGGTAQLALRGAGDQKLGRLSGGLVGGYGK